MTTAHGWGRYPIIDADISPQTADSAAIAALVRQGAPSIIARGMGRSYGDSSLSQQMIDCRGLVNVETNGIEGGIVRVGAGVMLSELLALIVPSGWFLPVIPGTKFVTVGGAIASDVHGKNHHVQGCFSEFVDSLDLMLAEGQTVTCSRFARSDLFRATCGGMGLTGLILGATLRLRPIRSSFVEQTTLKARNLEDLLDLFDDHRCASYSVAWIDCLAGGAAMGRSLLMLGEHSEHGGLMLKEQKPWSVPFDFPAQTLNRRSINMFNWLYYHRVRERKSVRNVHYENFFFPLDGILQWNRIYGRRGFIQYQFVVPKAAGLAGLNAAFGKIVNFRRGSFLGVLKLFGPANGNLLSFPLEGYTLSVDFKVERELFKLLDELDAIVLDHGGRLYLAKDARMTEAVFKQSYVRWGEFQNIRSSCGALGKFASLQSQRIALG